MVPSPPNTPRAALQPRTTRSLNRTAAQQQRCKQTRSGRLTMAEPSLLISGVLRTPVAPTASQADRADPVTTRCDACDRLDPGRLRLTGGTATARTRQRQSSWSLLERTKAGRRVTTLATRPSVAPRRERITATSRARRAPRLGDNRLQRGVEQGVEADNPHMARWVRLAA